MAQPKFIVVEDRIDPQGNIYEKDVFDPRSMCYSLFAAPAASVNYHKDILPHIIGSGRADLQKRLGRIVGGGRIQLNLSDGTIELREYSTSFKREPLVIRDKLTNLLARHVPSTQAVVEARGTAEEKAIAQEMNPYWLRFSSVLEDVTRLLSPEFLRFKTEMYT